MRICVPTLSRVLQTSSVAVCIVNSVYGGYFVADIRCTCLGAVLWTIPVYSPVIMASFIRLRAGQRDQLRAALVAAFNEAEDRRVVEFKACVKIQVGE